MASDVILDVTWDDLREMNVNQYFSVISITILVYDYYLTFVAEVERFWDGGQLSWASGFFYLNRYLVLFGHIPVMMEYFWTSSSENKIEICRKLQSYHQYLAIVIQLVVACMLIIRMYALYERSRRVIALYVGVAVTAVGIGCWAVLGGKSQKPREVLVPIGCSASLTHDQAIRLGAAWTGMLVFDTLVFGMTLYKAITLPRTNGVNLVTILMRDGSVYFAVMIAANLGNIMTFVFCGPFTRGVATTFTNVISSVMISRLMLNLRHPSLAPHSNRKSGFFSTTMTDDITFPNLTFIDQQLERQSSSRVSDTEESIALPPRFRSRYMYDYLAKGSSRRSNDKDRHDIDIASVHSDLLL